MGADGGGTGVGATTTAGGGGAPQAKRSRDTANADTMLTNALPEGRDGRGERGQCGRSIMGALENHVSS